MLTIKAFLTYNWESVLERRRFRIILWISIILSFGGVPFAYLTGKATDGQCGGALAVALALTTLFVSKDIGRKVFEDIINRKASSAQDIPTLVTAIQEAYKEAYETTETGERRKNHCLAWATAIGTLFWGFGDRVADIFIPHPDIPPPATVFIENPSVARFDCFDDSKAPPFLFSNGASTPTNLENGLKTISIWVDQNPRSKARLIGMIVIGSTDKRSLNSHLRQQYGENPGLAMDRAKAIAKIIGDRLNLPQLPPTSIMTISAGPTAFDSKDMANDRAVRVCGLWK